MPGSPQLRVRLCAGKSVLREEQVVPTTMVFVSRSRAPDSLSSPQGVGGDKGQTPAAGDRASGTRRRAQGGCPRPGPRGEGAGCPICKEEGVRLEETGARNRVGSSGGGVTVPGPSERDPNPSRPAPPPAACGLRPPRRRQKRIVGGKNSLR